MPAVTVLMAVYNALPFLPQTLDSVLNQTFTDFEFLIINDGSTDRSGEILRTYAARDPRIRLIERENRGFVASLNQGLDLAHGEFLARIDADDLCTPTRLADQVAYLRAHPDCVLVGGFVQLIDAKNRPLRTLRLPVDHADIDRYQLAGHTSIPHPVATFRLAAAKALGGYNPRYESAEDLDLWLRLAEVGAIHNIPRVLVQYRQHDNSMSSTHSQAQLDNMHAICRAAWTRRNVPGKFEMTEHWRPGPDRASRLRYALSTGWCAFNEGHRSTARIYALKALRLHPASLQAAKLLACALIKPSPKPQTAAEPLP
ncbi:MAG TPA: glycosyltransferase [Phycisphaerae bacterium]|nr:glycosyltransferase [Phycisphaerae bacterium]